MRRSAVYYGALRGRRQPREQRRHARGASAAQMRASRTTLMSCGSEL